MISLLSAFLPQSRSVQSSGENVAPAADMLPGCKHDLGTNPNFLLSYVTVMLVIRRNSAFLVIYYKPLWSSSSVKLINVYVLFYILWL